MAGDYRPAEPKRIHRGQHVVAKLVRLVPERGRARTPEAATRDTVDVIGRCELRRELIEDVRGVPQSREQDDDTARAAPVKYLQVYAVLDGNEPHVVRRRVEFLLRIDSSTEHQRGRAKP